MYSKLAKIVDVCMPETSMARTYGTNLAKKEGEAVNILTARSLPYWQTG